MKFLKVLINALISGIFFSALVTLLIMNLNIHLPMDPMFFAQFSILLSIVYGLVIAAAALIAFFTAQFLAGRKINLAFVSPSFLAVSSTVVLIIYLILFRENLKHFSTLFTPEIEFLLDRQTLTLAFLTLVGILTSFIILIYKKRIVFLIIYFLVLGGGLVYTVYLRVQYPPLPASETVASLAAKDIDKRITIIGIEGLSFDFIYPLTAENKLPNFSVLIENGCSGSLENFTPNVPVILNSSFNTGKLPAQHLQLTSSLYSLLNIETGIHILPRYIFFRQLLQTKLLKSAPLNLPARCKEIADIIEANQATCLKFDAPYPRGNIEITPELETSFLHFYEDLRFETDEIIEHLKQAFCKDVAREARANALKDEQQPTLFYLLLPGLMRAKAFFYKYSYPELFGEIDPEKLNKYATVIERYYQFCDEIIGKYLAAKKDDELLIVYSPHGVEALPMWKRITEWLFGNPDISAYHENAPEGVIFFYGKEIAPGESAEEFRIIDVAPTLLHYLGLPVGKDMDGVVHSSIFIDDFKAEPVLFIQSYEEIEIKTPE